MDGSTGDSQTPADIMMVPWLHFTAGDYLFFETWRPTSKGAIAGACIGLVLFSIFDRWVAAARGNLEHRWRHRYAQIIYHYSFAKRRFALEDSLPPCDLVSAPERHRLHPPMEVQKNLSTSDRMNNWPRRLPPAQSPRSSLRMTFLADSSMRLNLHWCIFSCWQLCTLCVSCDFARFLI